jgi:ABC-type branched-subunit amino acid transport system ATPase component
MSVLEARGIRKSFGRHQVLAGVGLAVAAGEMIAVVGENGSGKSTLLRILAGDLRPDRGSVVTHGQTGYCPQAVVLDDALTVDQHIRYFQAAYRIGAAGRADALINRLGYAAARHQPAGTLSGGTRQKLSLTLALLHEPALLLLDEPYQGFDWENLPGLLGPGRRVAGRGHGHPGHHPSGVRAGSFRPDLPSNVRTDRGRGGSPCASSLRSPSGTAWLPSPATGSPGSCSSPSSPAGTS